MFFTGKSLENNLILRLVHVCWGAAIPFLLVAVNLKIRKVFRNGYSFSIISSNFAQMKQEFHSSSSSSSI